MVVSGLEGGQGIEGLESDRVLWSRVAETGSVRLEDLLLGIKFGLDTDEEAVLADYCIGGDRGSVEDVGDETAVESGLTVSRGDQS